METEVEVRLPPPLVSSHLQQSFIVFEKKKFLWYSQDWGIFDLIYGTRG